MHKLASFLLVAAALPAFAEVPASTNAPASFNFTAPAKNCYFIRQANRQLQAPLDKPRMMPLASVERLGVATPFANCWPDQITIKTDVKKVAVP